MQRPHFNGSVKEFHMKFTSICISLAVLAPMAASAATPGQYSVGGRQQVCLLDDSTWYGTTFPGWGGVYYQKHARTVLAGSFDQGAGNDSMVFGPDLRGTWNEWTDDLQSHSLLTQVDLTFVKDACDPPPSRLDAQKSRPLQD
jgi:hypothetical protein